MRKLICVFVFILCFGINVQAKELAAKENVSPNKVWIIKLSDSIDQSTLNEIKVVDNYSNNIEIKKTMIGIKEIAIEPLDGAWGRGISYQLQTNNIKSVKGKLIKEPVTMNFTTAKTSFIPSGEYQTDEAYLYKYNSVINWHDGSKTKLLICDSVDIFDDSTGITVALNTDIWSTRNLLSSSKSKEVMSQLIKNAQNYMKQKYPNKNITVGIFLNEHLNKKIEGYTDSELSYDNKTGKYKLLVLLMSIYPDGKQVVRSAF